MDACRAQRDVDLDAAHAEDLDAVLLPLDEEQ